MISVIIPNRNKDPYLRDALDSLIAQSEPNWETIVIDDASQDKSVKILQAYKKRDSRFKIIELSKPIGGSAARNLGLDQASGEFVIFFDSDDILHPDCLSRRREYLEQNQSVDFAVFPMVNFVESIEQTGRVWSPQRNENHLELFLEHRLPWQTMQPIWRKEFVKKLGGFDPDLPRLQDVDLHTRALMVPDIRYAVAEGHPPDCYYRIFLSAKRSDMPFMQRWAHGAELYIKKTAKTILNEDVLPSSLLRHLRVTLLVTIGHLFWQHYSGLLSKSECTNLVDSLKEETSQYLEHSRVVDLYCFLGNLGFLRIKGMNWLFRFWVKC